MPSSGYGSNIAEYFPLPFPFNLAISPHNESEFSMTIWFKKLATTCAIIALSPSAMLAAAHAAEPAAAAAPATTDADPALWVVKDEDTTIYLFGTVHVLKPGLSWFDEAVKTAFDKSDQLMHT